MHRPAAGCGCCIRGSTADSQAPDMDPAVDESIRDFVDRKKASMKDQWY